MLKVYLDWNCINNIETRHPRLYEMIMEYGHLFIFPYSNAHIRDLLVSKDDSNPYYEKDLTTLTDICGKHLLQFENERTEPLFCLPKDYIELVGDIIEKIQKTDWLPREIYELLRENVRSYFPEKVQRKITGANPKEVFDIINESLKSIKYELSLEETTFALTDRLRIIMNEETKFKTLCMALDLYGFRPEDKKKSFTNIDADASHIFYASKCDYLISDDRKMRGKAEAMYSKYNVLTKVYTTQQFENLFIAELKKEYSVERIAKIVQQYGQPIENNDGKNYKILESPFLGLFNACLLINEHTASDTVLRSALFVYCFNTPYLYYTELEYFFNLIKCLLPIEYKESFQREYVDEICSRDKERAINAKYFFEVSNLNLVFEFYGDPISPVPCPMLKVIFK